ncbi:nucleotidyltransferase family protein [Erythrobacter sp. HKB08]|uniref:nucleotidyltransferase domain-containing protein n=1 Tax=Erythrobacter sp. HKB08 TaxID=2502843 RepID=UPI0013E89FF6|nr:nucleotidyltransferase family protein [Erythrobacter sp. HKB08]
MSEVEFDLLLAFLARNPARSPQDIARGGIDWDRFEALVNRHRVGALVGHGAAASGILPDALLERLQQQEMNNSARFLLTRSILQDLARRFEVREIRWVTLKGVIVAQRHYERPSLREMIDLDILIDRADFDAADLVLQDMGFERYHPRFPLEGTRRAHFMRLHSACSYIRRADGAQLDLHWRTVQNPNFLPALDENWREHVDASSSPPILHLPEHFAYLLVHGAKHGWQRLKWLVDIDRIISGLSQDQVSACASAIERHGLDDLAGAAFRLSRELLDTEMPPAFEALARRKQAIRLADLARELIAADIPEGGVKPDALGYITARVRHSLMLVSRKGYRRSALLREFARATDIGQVSLPKRGLPMLALITPLLTLTGRRS